MSSRAAILGAIRKNAAPPKPLPIVTLPAGAATYEPVAKFTEVLTGIGGRVVPLWPGDDLCAIISQVYADMGSIVTTLKDTPFDAVPPAAEDEPQVLAPVEVALLPAMMGVAENGAVWLTEAQYRIRVLPFICQHLAVVLQADAIVANMHDAYEHIAGQAYGFGVFIAGPSKTADIEQSLVLGAHGPKTMTVFLLYS
jgi:L-lactate dehydrogenase complex protein LldG